MKCSPFLIQGPILSKVSHKSAISGPGEVWGVKIKGYLAKEKREVFYLSSMTTPLVYNAVIYFHVNYQHVL